MTRLAEAGPVVVFGLGGVATDVLDDRAARLAPLTGADADDLPQVAELDLNPVIVRPDGVVAVDTRIRVTSHRLADPFLRLLPGAPGDVTPRP